MKFKITTLVFLFAFIIPLLTGCSKHIYDKDWVIGKNSDEIIEKYGDFYTVSMPKSNVDGRYYNTACSYLIRKKKVGYLGTTPEQLFTISFNKNGIATRCYDEIGGKGG